GRRDRRREPVSDLLSHRRPAAAPSRRDARPLHLHHVVDQLLLAVHRPEPVQPDPARRPRHAAGQLFRRLLDRSRRCAPRHRALAGPLRLRRPPARRGDHARRDQGLRAVPFPAGFLWGTATAAAQIEGGAHEDGKEDSIWDAFARVPDAIAHGDTPEVASDHYHRMPEDVALMKRLGLSAYRFSVSWARVKPGDREVNARGLDFYDRLVDELLEAGITPWLTLYHWDLPQALQEKGGWANRDTAYRFRDFAVAVHGALSDRVSHWTTFNEPLCSSLIGYASGEHAPGLRDPRAALAAVHHQHLAHGLAVEALRDGPVRKLGITLNRTNAIPNAPADPVDVEAARRVDAVFNRMYLEPILLARYPADLVADVHEFGLTDVIRDGDLELIGAPIDFLGVNYYHDDNVSGHPLPAGAHQSLAPTPRPKSSPFVGSEYVTFPSRDLP